jgi:hypothetical protein
MLAAYFERVFRRGAMLVLFVATASLALGASAGAAGPARSANTRARPANGQAFEFFAPPALGMECGMYLSGVHCQSERVHPYFAQVAELKPNGSATFCAARRVSNRCDLGNAGEHASRLGYGRKATVGGFRCVVLRSGIECTIIASGKGFLITRSGMRGVGGAITRPQPLRLQDFLSPDRSVWCGLGEPRSFCGTGLAGLHQVFPAGSAQIDAEGNVTICFIARESEARLLDGHPEGCLQNWDEKAPVLRYGQQSELGGVLCTSATSGITCLETSGARAGEGFRVSSSEAVAASEPGAVG